ncbi:MAG: hypothetical protein ABI992_09140 [Chthoniobacterales bacterium]
MSTEKIADTPPKGGLGCVGKGCATLAGLLAFLTFALLAGTFWGLHYLRSYSATAPVQLPVLASSTPAPATSKSTDEVAAAPQAPTRPAMPEVNTWEAFRRAARKGEAVRIQLTAYDINRLIAADPAARGKVFVATDHDVGRVQMSFPLEGVPFVHDRFLNGELSLQSSPDGDPAKVRVSRILLNGQSVPEAFLDRSFFGYPSLRTVVEKWIRKEHLASFRIENDRVIGESSGAP